MAMEVEDGINTTKLIEIVVEKFPKLSSEMGEISLAVNKSYIESQLELKEGDEVAFLPPISGG